MRLIGIDDLDLYASTRALDLRALAVARGLPESSLADAGFVRRSVPPAWEDPVTLCVNAAAPLLVGRDKRKIGLLVVATETGLDFGKPLSSWVHRLLDLPTACRNFEIKHACFGGTAGLLLARDWVAAHPDREALVVMADLARPHAGDRAELTAGAGAVALVVSADPRVLALDAISGSAAREVRDVCRPTATGEHIDPVLSLSSFLDLAELAWDDLVARTPARLEDFDAVLMHAPLVSLVRAAWQAVCALDGADSGAWGSRVEPWLRLNREVANLYSASLYASLLQLACGGAPGDRVALFSYGSGACAEWFTGTLGPRAREVVGAHRSEARLAERVPLSPEMFDQADQALQANLVAQDHTPARDEHWACWEGSGRLALVQVQGGERRYRWA
jgi:3-hydroxy-3-methylglutaryl CoA synthase